MGAAGSRFGLLALLCAACTSTVVDARTFEGTRWHVRSINGQATPVAGDYRLEFNDGGIGGRFGCNGFGGRYSVANEALIAREVASTLMGCPEPTASFESQGFAVLHQPMRMTWTDGRHLTLSNGSGSIALERLP